MIRRVLTTWFRRYVLDDIWRLMLALTLALICWFTLRPQLTQRRDIIAKVVVEHDAAKYYVSEVDRSKDVELTVSMVRERNSSTVRQFLRELSAQDSAVELHVKLTSSKIDGRESGEAEFSMYDLKAPTGIVIEAMNPPKFNVRFDRKISKVVAVKPPADVPYGGYMLTFPSIEPMRITLTGPSHYLKETAEVMLEEPSWLSGAPQTGRGDEGGRSVPPAVLVSPEALPATCEMKIKMPYLGTVDYSHAKVTATMKAVDIGVKVARRMHCPFKVLFVPPQMECVTNVDKPIFVELRGTSKALNAFDEKKAFAYVNLNDVTEEGTVDAEIRVAGIPYDIECESVVPNRVKLAVRKKAMADSTPVAP